ncbi:Poly(3-hydroxyalkanoate) depolymerase [uncultured Rubrobacteraceae bacterium]|uniref:Poly(3-hydroxyalkanoate) depolymerase n=1 Tax=uncultured Rubrobacteraceae bacterium TaxID=349277 RepID=A0A6J4PHH5_9ACTN|nr:Poly(3-hydroxyalkanoate) depolymerase [uncultured Rubrobacteraceae bacterium]
MNDQMQSGMAEATRLTQQGRLDEATAAIQRALGGTFVPSTEPGSSGDAPIDVTSRIVKGTRQRPAASRRTAGRRPGGATQTTPSPNLFTRGVGNPLGTAVGSAASAGVPEGARFLEGSYTNGAGTRSYKLYVPSGYTGQDVPLIVMLHGCTQNPDDFATGTRMNGLAEENTFLVAYPAQSGNANMQKCWNWFQASDQQRGRGEPSIIAGITKQVMDEYSVAGGRVYVAGMSAGGAMAAILGATYPDLYAAVGVHSGLAPGAAHDLSSAFTAMRQGGPVVAQPKNTGKGIQEIVPTIIFHGDGDTTVHPRNGERLLAHLDAGDRDGSSPRVSTRRGGVPGGHEYTRFTYKDGEGRELVERWSVHGLGHAWSGGSYPGSYTDPKGPDASAEMVRFFGQHHRR